MISIDRLKLVLALSGTGLLSACGGPDAPAASRDCAVISAESKGDERSDPVEIESGAARAYGQFTAAEITKVWGKVIDQVNKVREEAAIAVSYNPECDQVASVGMSDLAVPPSDIVVVVTCGNARRFEMTSAAISRAAESEQRKACRLKPDAVQQICEARLKRETKFSAISYDPKTAFVMADGRWQGTIVANLTMPGRPQRQLVARCVVKADGGITSFAVTADQ